VQRADARPRRGPTHAPAKLAPWKPATVAVGGGALLTLARGLRRAGARGRLLATLASPAGIAGIGAVAIAPTALAWAAHSVKT
jgi:hypothetical protein